MSAIQGCHRELRTRSGTRICAHGICTLGIDLGLGLFFLFMSVANKEGFSMLVDCRAISKMPTYCSKPSSLKGVVLNPGRKLEREFSPISSDGLSKLILP